MEQFLAGIFTGLGQDAVMGERLATAAKAIYIVNVPTLANTLWAHTKKPKEDDAWNTFLALVHQIGVPKTAVRTVEAELLSRLREKDWEPAAPLTTRPRSQKPRWSQG